ncbi:transglutaminaseTgpA domain-containing protein [Glutamicibacter sp. NPDC087583]|uniref:transglutaminase family protein n=1 Tax=Glutamicibacter sp. NPDC087583 TaxID=3363995 RepID=UPI003829E14A
MMSAGRTGASILAPTPDNPDPSVGSAPAMRLLLVRVAAACCLAVAVLAGAASLSGVIEGSSWFPALVLPVFAVHLCAGLLRAVRRLRWSALPAAAIVAVASIALSDARESNIYGLPLAQWVWNVLGEAGIQLATQVPPVANSRSVAFSVLCFTLAISLIVEMLASSRRMAMLIIIPLSLAPIIASLFKQEGAGIGYLALLLSAVLGYIALIPYLFAPASSKHSQVMLPTPRTLGILGVSVMACVGALLAASIWMPGFRSGMFSEGQRPSGDLLASNVDPLINLGRDLRSNSGVPILDYYTTAEEAPYLRTQVIKDLSADRWEPSESSMQHTLDGTSAVSTNFSTFNSTDEVLRMTWPDGISSPVLPLPNQSYFVQGIVGDWNWTYETSVARLTGDAMASTNDISVAYADLAISTQMVRNVGHMGVDASDQLPEEYLRLPQDPDNGLEPLLQQTLDEVFGKKGKPANDIDTAVALQHFFRSGNFVYSERTPLREGYDGANRRVVEAFLARRQGYCVHFASAMALLAREAGIPSRIAVGYAPGEASGDTLEITGDTAQSMLERRLEEGTELTGYTVSGKQSHAWPELYLNGLGWIPFEPTPGRGYSPSYAPEPTPTSNPQESTAPQVPTERGNPSLPASAAPSAPAPSADSGTQGAKAVWLLPAVLLLAFLALGVAPWRRHRLREERLGRVRRGGADAAPALLAELQAIGADYRGPAGSHESAGDYTTRLGEDHPQVAKDLQSLKTVIQESFYANRQPSADDAAPLLDALHAIQGNLRGELSFIQRIRAFLFPASVHPRHSRSEESTRIDM